MATEEKLLLPLASRHLLPQDWADVASAFESHADPRFDIEAEQSFDRVFTRLMNLAAAAAPRARLSRPAALSERRGRDGPRGPAR